MSKKTDLSSHVGVQEINKLRQELEEWKRRYLRAIADYQNLEKRVAQEQRDKIKLASKNIVFKILPILDILEKAESIVSDQGISFAVKLFRDVLREEQVEKTEVVGKKFDPNIMECIDVVSSDKEDEVVEEVRAGYTIFGKVIRVAQVKVGKRHIDKKAEELAKEELKKGNYM